MVNKADFSDEQLYLIGKALKLREEELEFFLLLGAWARSSQCRHKSYLQGKIEKIQKKMQRVIDKLENVYTEVSEKDIADYYKATITAKIHIFLTIDKYRDNPNLLVKKLAISENRLQIELRKLEELGLINISQGKIQILKYGIHLDDSHPISKENHKNWRLETMHYLTKNEPKPLDYHLSATFSCDEKAATQIKEEVKRCVVKIQSLVNKCQSSDEVYFIGLDIY